MQRKAWINEAEWRALLARLGLPETTPATTVIRRGLGLPDVKHGGARAGAGRKPRKEKKEVK